MRLTEMWTSRKEPTVSFEVFPPRTEKAAAAFGQVLDELVALKPDFFAVTFGAGGSTREGSCQLVEKLKKEKKQEVIAYFAGFGLGPDKITSILDDYRKIGIENVLVVRGDQPQDEESFRADPRSFAHACEMISFVRPKYRFCLGAAGYPEGHVEAENRAKDLEYLKMKVDNGAEFVIANYFYENRFFFDFVERCRKAGITVPILPGVMPVYSVKMMNRLAEICGASIPGELDRKISAVPEGDAAALTAVGVEYALDQCRELIKSGVPGLHLYTMDRSASAAGIVNRLRGEKLI